MPLISLFSTTPGKSKVSGSSRDNWKCKCGGQPPFSDSLPILAITSPELIFIPISSPFRLCLERWPCNTQNLSELLSRDNSDDFIKSISCSVMIVGPYEPSSGLIPKLCIFHQRKHKRGIYRCTNINSNVNISNSTKYFGFIHAWSKFIVSSI